MCHSTLVPATKRRPEANRLAVIDMLETRRKAATSPTQPKSRPRQNRCVYSKRLALNIDYDVTRPLPLYCCATITFTISDYYTTTKRITM
jgi:hypothetical protein